MTNDEIIQGNKLIAEFMGMERTEKEIGETTYKQENNCVIWASQLKYHSSFDWLMPAIRAAKAKGNSSEYPWWDNLNYYLKLCEINGTFIELVRFIQWYNNQNKNTQP